MLWVADVLKELLRVVAVMAAPGGVIAVVVMMRGARKREGEDTAVDSGKMKQDRALTSVEQSGLLEGWHGLVTELKSQVKAVQDDLNKASQKIEDLTLEARDAREKAEQAEAAVVGLSIREPIHQLYEQVLREYITRQLPPPPPDYPEGIDPDLLKPGKDTK